VLTQEASRVLYRAGARALWAASDYPAAIALLRRAETLVPADQEFFELKLDLGAALKFSGDATSAEDLLVEVANRARHAGDRRVELRAELELLRPRWASGRLTTREALDVLAEALGVLEETTDYISRARAFHLLAVMELEQDRCGEAEAAARQALLLYRRAGLPNEFGGSLLASVLVAGPSPVEGAIRDCRELLAATVSPGWRSFVLPRLARLEAMRGSFDAAHEHLEEARIGRREWREPGTLAMDWAFDKAFVASLAHHRDVAESVLLEACETLRAMGERAWLSTHLGGLAIAVAEQGRPEEALAFAKEASALALPDDKVAQTLWRRGRARALATGGKLAPAERLAREAVVIRNGSDMLNDLAESLVVLAEILGMRRKTTEAADVLGKALALFHAKGNLVAADATRASLLALAG
jgi:tetratricopeptide (TPR) repeat protein